MNAAAAYYRKSTDRQEASIPTQRAEVQAYAARHGYTIIREYQDEGISGDDTEKRLQFQQMLRDATERRDFNVVLCWDQDRFGRFDPLEAGFWIKPLRDAGVRLETVAQGKIDWDDFAGRIIYAVQQEGKHAFLRDLSRNTARGMLAKARLGLWLGGPAPYGYVVRDQRLVPGSAERVEVVRWLFRTYASQVTSLGELARQLNERRVPAPRGGLWYKTAVHKILTRPAYRGDLAWNRRHDGKYHEITGGQLRATPGRRRKGPWGNPAEEWIIARDAHEPLIDRATFEKVQRRLEEQREHKTPRTKGGGFFFTGLLFCGNCGSPMHGCTARKTVTRTRRGNPTAPKRYDYRRYICGAYNAHGSAACKCNTIPEHRLLAAVVRRIQDDFLNPDNLEKLRGELRAQLAARGPDNAGRARTMRGQLADLDRKIDQGAERLLAAPADLTEMLTAKLREWQEQRGRLQRELEALERVQPTGDPEALVERAIARLAQLRDWLNQCDPARLREVIRQAVSKVECWFEHAPYGRREKSVLSRGLIHLRPDVLVTRDVPCGRPLMTVHPARARSPARRSATRRP
jgi:DNA invertase Pin-like site-specific DNA recombinase